MNFKLKHRAKINSLEPGNTDNGSIPSGNGGGNTSGSTPLDKKINSNPFVSSKVKQMREETKFIREATGPEKAEHSKLSDYGKQVQAHKHGFSVSREEGSTGLTYTKRNGSGSMTTSQGAGSSYERGHCHSTIAADSRIRQLHLS